MTPRRIPKNVWQLLSRVAENWRTEKKRKKADREPRESKNWQRQQAESSKIIVESEKSEVQKEQQTEEGKLKKKEEVRAYQPTIPFAQRMQK